MINLVRGEWYKMVRSKCFYICCVVVVVFSFALYGIFSLAEAVKTGAMASDTLVVTSDSGSIWAEMTLFSMAKALFSMAGTLAVAVYVAILLFGDYANGAIKNVAGKGYRRSTVFSAKFLMISVGAVIIEIVLALGVLICEALFLKGERLTTENLCAYAAYVGMQLLFAVAFAGIMVLINQLCRNLGLGIAVSVGMIMFSSIITMGINTILQYFRINVDVCKYWIIDLMSECPATDIGNGFLLRACVCSLAWIAVTLVAGSIHFREVDIK